MLSTLSHVTVPIVEIDTALHVCTAALVVTKGTLIST
jgi:hypothetical protein